MSSETTDSVRMLTDSVTAFVRDQTDHKRGRALRGALPGYDRKIYADMAALGWCGVLIPEAYGGAGLGFQDMAVVLRGLASGLLADPVCAAVVLGARALLHGDNDGLKARLLPEVAAGRCLPGLAWSESHLELDPAVIATVAVRQGPDLLLNGTKKFVPGAASDFLVTALAPDGLVLCRVARDAPGVGLELAWRADGTPSATLHLSDVGVAAADVAASAQVGAAAVRRALDEALVMESAELVGVMDAAMTMTLDYMRTRVQYDKPIGSFQALQHKAADMYILRQVAEAVAGEAAELLDANPDERDRAMMASRAKARCGDAGLQITRESIQLHGGIGYTDAGDIGLYLKRALVLSAWLGNADLHRRRYASLAM